MGRNVTQQCNGGLGAGSKRNQAGTAVAMMMVTGKTLRRTGLVLIVTAIFMMTLIVIHFRPNLERHLAEDQMCMIC